MQGRGRRATLLAIIATVGILVVAAVILRRPLLEAWHIARLDSGEEEVRRASAARLGELRSERAVPRLIEHMRRNAADAFPRLERMAVYERLLGTRTVKISGDSTLLGLLMFLHQLSGVNFVLKASVPPDASLPFPKGQTTVEGVLKDLTAQVDGVYRVEENHVWIADRADPAVSALSEPAWPDPKDLWASGAPSAIGRGAVPPLVEALDDETLTVRIAAAYTLWKAGAEAKRAVPALVDRLQDDHPVVRGLAAAALGRIGPDSRAAIAALKLAAEDPNLEVGARAEEALKATGDERR